ncbi:MAG TPA: sulfur carrier protein ThiS [Candidatus Eremiobacteraeota bacterium]|nr:sulfur carrier protein ThiS [Candidatus Eremiobacteraeota bacterium]
MITVNGNKIDWHEGMTVTEIFNIMGYDFSLIVTSVNDELVLEDDYDIFYVPDEADVKAIHIYHGG